MIYHKIKLLAISPSPNSNIMITGYKYQAFRIVIIKMFADQYNLVV